MPANEICEGLQLDTTRKRSVGEPRRALGAENIYQETYCVFHLPRRPDLGLIEIIEEFLHRLEGQKDFLRKINATGGKVQLYVACFFDKNSGEVFNSEVLRKFGDLDISLAFDVYPYLPESGSNEGKVVVKS